MTKSIREQMKFDQHGNCKAAIDALESDLAVARKEIHRARTDPTYWSQFNTMAVGDAIRDQNTALKAMLKELEWTVYDLGILFCPCCKHARPNHSNYCRLAKLLEEV